MHWLILAQEKTATNDFFSGGSGWTSFGLAGLILAWLLLKHLPDKDKQSTKKDQQLVTAIQEKAVELASEKLHSRREMYLNALAMREEDGAFILALDASANWIEDGMPSRNLLESLLKSPKAKRAKDGSSYIVVPFGLGPGKGATNTPASTLDLVDTVKAELKRRKIPLGGIERDDQGRPKLGRLHKFDINSGPDKTHQGPGQGWGPIGAPKQGPNARQKVGGGPGGGGLPFLAGVNIFQHAVEGGGVKRSITTFRVASSKHEAPRWDVGELAGVHIFDELEKWAEEQVNLIVPKLIKELALKL